MAVLTTVSDESEAQLVVALLRAEGIPALVEGGFLMDEWAMSQRVMGQVGVEVKVPSSDLERAAVILEEAHERGAVLVDHDGEPLEVEPHDENAGFPSEEELAQYAQKPAYQWFVLTLAVIGTGLIFWVLIYVAFFL